MTDIIEVFENSTIQHGKENDRIYLMKLNPNKTEEIIDYIEKLSLEKKYSKIFAKIPVNYISLFNEKGYKTEAFVPKFFNGETDGVFLAKYPLPQSKREFLSKKELIDDIIRITKSKTEKVDSKLSFKFQILDKNDSETIARLYKKVFITYPFPIFDPKYILKTMEENVCYFGIKEQGELISISSAEMDKENKNVEMTDFATLPEFRRKGLALFLLRQMENYVAKHGFKTSYTIARAISHGANIIFGKNNYNFGGTLVNNTNIAGNIESMNVWYKSL